MALREQSVNDGTGVPPERLQTEENTQEDATVDDTDEFSLAVLPPASARDRRRRERDNKPKCKEMSEEEMMDLALRLSEREATVTASRLKQEEEAMMKAIKESMLNQTQTVPSSQSQSLLADEHADVSPRLCSRRKLLYSNGKTTLASYQGDNCPVQTGEVKATGDENNNRNKKRKREEGGSLPEMPDLMQTQDVYSQASLCSSESVSVPLDSLQSSDSTQIDDCQLRKSPVFPLTGCRATVCISRLSQELLETCKVSGFVSCSQDNWIQKSPIQAKSPMNFTAGPNSPVFTDSDRGDDGEQVSPERGGSWVFGRTAQQDQSPSACKPQVCKNSGFTFSPRETLISTGSSASRRPDRPESPVFAGSLPSVETSAISRSPVFSGTEAGQAEQRRGCSTSPVCGSTGQRQTVDPDVMNSSVVPSSAEPRGSNGEEPSQSLEETCKAPSQDGGFKKLSQSVTADAQDSEDSKGCSSAEAELSSDMTLLWSDGDDDITPAGSPSPVFPEERPVREADPETTGSNCRTSSRGTRKRALGPCGEPTAVHYYWGVPFCPRGLDPDKYTEVILAQMEVYEKSLKQAQRCLLRKVEWGEPVLPQPENYRSPESPAESPQPHIPQRHALRLQRRKRHESADTSAEEEEERETNAENKEEEKKDGGGDTDNCEVCPETQLSDVNNDDQDLPVVPDDVQVRPGSTELPEAERILPGDSPAAGPRVEEEMEVGGTTARPANAAVWSEDVFSAPDPRETEASWNSGNLKEGRLVTDVEEVTEQKLQRSASPEVEAAAAPRSPEAHMDCPICQGSFPVTEIEVHAAYCDGEVAIVDERRAEAPSLPNTLKPRRKRPRRVEATDEEVGGRNQEKCYVCQKAVPLREYSRHTELCIQQQAAKPEARGNLLSALERSEARDSGAGPSRLQPGDIIDLRDDEDDGGVSGFRISDSPSRSFTPISAAANCLVDFRKPERSKKPSRRRR